MKKIVLAASMMIGASSLCAFSMGDAMNAASSLQQPKQASATTATKSQSNDLTSMLTSQLGVSEKQANGGVGSILSYAKDELPKSKYTELASAIPNSDSLLSMVSGSGSSSLGQMGALAGAMGGSNTAKLASLASQFSSLGLSSDMVGKFVPVIMNYFKSSNSTGAASILSSLF